MTVFRPMLAATCKAISELRLPGLASGKVDGIRCVVHPKLGPVTRKLEDIPNIYVRAQLKRMQRHYPEALFDGELVVGDTNDPHTWNATQSGIMSEDGRPDFKFMLFDYMPSLSAVHIRYQDRYRLLPEIVGELRAALHCQWLHWLSHTWVHNHADLHKFEAKSIKNGFEGTMLRSLDGPYKQGRSSLKEGWLVKIKRVQDAEAVIVGFEEMMHNANEAEVSKLGYTKRSGHKANKVGKNTLGKFIVRATFDTPGELVSAPVLFNIGTGLGLTAKLRAEIWASREKWMGRTIRFKYQKLSPEGKPIFPIYLGARED